MRLIKSTPKGKQRVYDIEVADVHNFYANGINVHNCATNGGVSVIKDDGSVVDITGQAEPPYRITFNKSNPNEIITSGYWTRVMKIYNIPASDVGEGTQLRYYVDSETPKLPFGGGALNFESSQTQELSVSVSGGTPANGFYKIAENLQSKLNGMTAYIRTDCNTGWMHGDIKGAWLSDTSTASVTGTELNQYGDFSSTTGWGSRSASWTISGGVASVSSGAGYQFLGSTSGTLTNGRKYAITVNVTAFTAGRLEFSQTNSSNIPFNVGSTGIKTLILTYTGSTGYGLGIYGYGDASYSFTIDDLHVRELSEPDRSVNNKGLAVYGTITKTAVATGANLVGYSGFSGSNYLLQPQNTALDFGTGDFSIMFWGIMVPLNGSYIAFQINHVAGNTNLFMDGLGLAITIGGNNKLYQNTSSNNIGWSHQTIVRRSGILYYYSNARLITSNTSTESLVTNSSSTLKIGEGFNQYLALFRISASAPSPEQILKIYNDEKMLFQENSQATLYGASDAVTALAYDDTTKLLSVGTSSGRSDFQGLRRINNTTTAVTTAISASNGLIAEQ